MTIDRRAMIAGAAGFDRHVPAAGDPHLAAPAPDSRNG